MTGHRNIARLSVFMCSGQSSGVARMSAARAAFKFAALCHARGRHLLSVCQKFFRQPFFANHSFFRPSEILSALKIFLLTQKISIPLKTLMYAPFHLLQRCNFAAPLKVPPGAARPNRPPPLLRHWANPF